MAQTFQNILIGGASHVGKSTLAKALGEALGWEVFSTDQMARHPGRPWPKTRPHVAEFYNSLSPESIFTFLLHHHDNMWPGIQRFLSDQHDAGNPYILEGSALRPEFLSKLPANQYARIFLTAPATFIEQRVRVNSGYVKLSSDMRSVVDAFVERSIRDNTSMIEAAEIHEIGCVDVSDPRNVERIQGKLTASAIVGCF
ncbi:hypothetical protein [Pacificibacter sp. AS14]|uniref:hypothetical protein n=1 Tax=Pacificibacter sp. AS14 TaxID=3135785 RepID=UPI003180115F